MSQTLPVWLATGTIQTVWPSRFLALKQCMLREAAAAGGQEPLMPMSSRAQLGTGIHSMFERAATDPSFPTQPAGFAAEWDKMVAEAEHKLSATPYTQAVLPLMRSIPNIGLIRSRTLIGLAEVRAAAPLPSAISGSSQTPQQRGKFSNKVGTVVGIPDRITYTPEGVVISDFKTGTFLQQDGTVTPDYQTQLKLYAALFRDNYTDWPARLEIVSVSGQRIPVPFTTRECETLLNDAHKLCLKARKQTPSLAACPDKQKEAAAPKPDTCRFCAFRPHCPAYLDAAFSRSPLCPSDVAGTLVRWSTSGNGAILVELHSTKGTLVVRSIPPVGPALVALSASAPGEKILIASLKHDNTNLFSATSNTAVHTYRQTPSENSAP
jgi:hypothetical protein